MLKIHPLTGRIYESNDFPLTSMINYLANRGGSIYVRGVTGFCSCKTRIHHMTSMEGGNAKRLSGTTFAHVNKQDAEAVFNWSIE
jgi:hypothetical protein